MIQENIRYDDLIEWSSQERVFYMFFQDAPNKEKVVFGLGPGKHLTVHFGTKSKELDIHISDESVALGDEGRYQTLLRIPYSVLEELLPQIGEIVMRNHKRYFASTRINLGKLTHHGCYLVRMDNSNTEKFASITNKRFKLNKTFSKQSILSLFTTPKDIISSRPSNLFQVFKVKRGHHIHAGVIWFHPEMKDNRPFFVSMKNFNLMTASIRREVYQKSLELGVTINTDLWNEIIRGSNIKKRQVSTI